LHLVGHHLQLCKSMVLSKLTGLVYASLFYTVCSDISAECLDSIHWFRNRIYFSNAASQSNDDQQDASFWSSFTIILTMHGHTDVKTF